MTASLIDRKASPAPSSRKSRLVAVKDVTRHYQIGDSTVKALDGVSFSIAQAEFVAVVGPSGSGKSTMMNLLGALDQPTSGSILFDGEELGRLSSDELAEFRNTRIGFVFQQFNLLANTTALRQVLLPASYQRDRRRGKERTARAEALMRQVGLADRMNYLPSQLSGGQQQRVAIARALINSPRLLLADEPTGALDTSTSSEILDLLETLNDQGLTVVVVTHDPEVAKRARRIIRFRDGRIEADEATARPKLKDAS